MSSTSRWIKISAEVAGAAAAIAAGAVAVGTFVWNRKTRRNVTRLTTRSLALRADRTRTTTRTPRGSRSPFCRHRSRAVLSSHSRRAAPDPNSNSPANRSSPCRCEFCMDSFVGGGAFSVHPPGFIWDASCRMAPFVPFRIRDSYIAGKGASEASVAGVIRVGGHVIHAKSHPLRSFGFWPRRHGFPQRCCRTRK